jgi:hypothetical protein
VHYRANLFAVAGVAVAGRRNDLLSRSFTTEITEAAEKLKMYGRSFVSVSSVLARP